MAGAIKAPSGYGCVLPGVLVCTRTGCSAGAEHPAQRAAGTLALLLCTHGSGAPLPRIATGVPTSPRPCPRGRAPMPAWLLGWVRFGKPGALLCPAS